MHVVNKPILKVNDNVLHENGFSRIDVEKYFPRYILNPTSLRYGQIKGIWFSLAQCFLRTLVNIFLHPRQTSIGALNQLEIDEVYDREADGYDLKHHLTTRGMDLIWRRAAGWFVSTIGQNGSNSLGVLDLCTGTGLTAQEIVKIAEMRNLNVFVAALDYNQQMLDVAKRRGRDNGHINFIRGDATNLLKNSDKGIGRFPPNTFDAVTQIFGIGGVPEPIKAFYGVLAVLKPGGKFLMVDMHKPIPELPGEWPFLRWFRFPIFETAAYEQSTIPLVLNRLWGWRDTTLLFYILPLVTRIDEDKRYWGFEVQSFEQESHRWWFGLPIMPVARVVVKKSEIDERTWKMRRAILKACSF